jgi:hypothetical protein
MLGNARPLAFYGVKSCRQALPKSNIWMRLGYLSLSKQRANGSGHVGVSHYELGFIVASKQKLP